MDRKTRLKQFVMHCMHLIFPFHGRTVVFCSFSGGAYSDNPKAISEELHRTDPSVRQVWLFNEPEKKKSLLPPYVHVAKRWGVRSVWALATAGVWVFNDTVPAWAYKGRRQLYVQTWHGDRGFKKILHDANRIMDESLFLEPKICDLMLSGSDFGVTVARSAFRYTGKILKTGTPRNDRLVSPDPKSVEEKKLRMGLDPSVRYLLYAPTMRQQNAHVQKRQAIQEIDLVSVASRLGEGWKVLVRAHVKVSELDGIPDSERIVNVSAYEDMADLLEIADILITDYSSSAGDFALTGRPIILYQNDREQYEEHDRTFYFDLDASPFWIAKNQEELHSILKDLPNRDSKKNCEAICSFYRTFETGHASKDVCSHLLGQMH